MICVAYPVFVDRGWFPLGRVGGRSEVLGRRGRAVGLGWSQGVEALVCGQDGFCPGPVVGQP